MLINLTIFADFGSYLID